MVAFVFTGVAFLFPAVYYSYQYNECLMENYINLYLRLSKEIANDYNNYLDNSYIYSKELLERKNYVDFCEQNPDMIYNRVYFLKQKPEIIDKYENKLFQMRYLKRKFDKDETIKYLEDMAIEDLSISFCLIIAASFIGLATSI